MPHRFCAWAERQPAGRLAAGFIAAFVPLWTLYALISRAGKDVHFDVGELVGWWREPALRYHPPMSSWVAGLWFELFPRADWAAYLLGSAWVGLALAIAWPLFRLRLDADKSLAALAMLALVPLYTFHAARFNANLVMLPFWAATILFVLRSFPAGRLGDAALAGLAGAGAMLGKYWTLTLLAGIAAATLLDRRRGAYWRSPNPYLSLAVGALALTPYAAGVLTDGSGSLFYAAAVRQAWSPERAFGHAFEYLAGAAAYAIGPILALAFLRPPRAAWGAAFNPADPAARFAARLFWLPLLIPPVLNLAWATRLTSLWTMPNWLLLPVVLLQSPQVTVTRRAAVRLLAAALLFAALMTCLAPVIAIAMHRSGASAEHAYFRQLAAAVETEWRAVSERPLRFVGGEPRLARGAVFYLAEGAANTEAPAGSGSLRDGIVLLCETADRSCLERIAAFGGAGVRRAEVTLTRDLWGTQPRSERFVVMAVPPR